MAAVEEGDVVKRVGHEVGLELAVDHIQDVAVELGRDAGGVVVGGFDHGGVLDEIRSEEKAIVGTENAGDVAQQRAPGAGREVADRAA